MGDSYQVLQGHTSDVTSLDFSHGGLLVSGSNDKSLRIWKKGSDGLFVENTTSHPPSPLIGHKYGVNGVKFSPFDTIIASCSTDGGIILWNAQTGQQVVKLQHPSSGAIRVCCFSPSSAVLASGSDDDTVCLWDISTRALIRSFVGHEAMITALSFTPDSSFLVSGSSAGDLKVWDARHGHGKCLVTLQEAHDLGVLCCDFSSQYQVDSATIAMQSYYFLASCGHDDRVKLWHVKSGTICTITLSHVLEGHTGNVNCCRFSADGNFLASAAGDKTVIIWSSSTGRLLSRLEGHSRYVTSCAFSPDSRFLATGSNDKTIFVWPIDLASLKGEEENGFSISMDARPNLITLGSMDDASGNSTVKSTVSNWTVDDVAIWLNDLGLKEYETVFRSHQVDGQELLHLTHDTLLTSLKISALGPRNKILRSIQGLRNPLWQHISAMSEENLSMPSELMCPITQEFMRQPVVAADGYSYERDAIIKWFENGKKNSPMTNEPLANLEVIDNKTLALLIKKYISP